MDHGGGREKAGRPKKRLKQSSMQAREAGSLDRILTSKEMNTSWSFEKVVPGKTSAH